jgi:hypothetical protein
MAISGLTADARILCKYMRNECLNHKYMYESNHPINRLIFKISESNTIYIFFKNFFKFLIINTKLFIKIIKNHNTKPKFMVRDLMESDCWLLDMM